MKLLTKIMITITIRIILKYKEARNCDQIVVLSIPQERVTLCSPELSFVSSCFSPLNSSVPDPKIQSLTRYVNPQ